MRFGIRNLALVCALAASSQAGAVDASRFSEKVESLSRLETRIDQGELSRANGSIPPRTKDEAVCQSAYRKLYANAHLAIAIVFGYNDQRPYTHVLDGSEKETLREGLMSPCRARSERLCGFSEGADKILRKTIEGVDGQPVLAEILLVSSSVSESDDQNRTVHRERQRATSKAARDAFAGAIRTADVVLYLGHARNGGGPDFAPPMLNDEGKVNLPIYEKRREGVKLMQESLAGAKRLKLFGLFACAANAHFAGELRRARPDIGFLLAGEITRPTPMNSALWGALHSVLGRTCRRGFAEALSAPPEGYEPSSFSIHGFL